MLYVENIKKGLSSVDDRPCVLWEGIGDPPRHTKKYRIILSKRNTLIVETVYSKDAMEQDIWNKTTDLKEDGEILAKVFLDSLKEMYGGK